MPSEIPCVACESRFSEDTLVLWDGNYWCDDCLRDDTFICEGCNRRFYNDDSFRDGDCLYCEDCYRDPYEFEDNEESEVFPIINIPFKKIQSKGFKINKFKNFCGVEIECLNNTLYEESFNYKELIKQYNFSQIHDGSLSSRRGVEFVSNAFNGDCLFNKIKTFCRKLQEREYYVDTSCGLHIHIAVSKRLKYLKKIFAFYLIFEDKFFRMLPKSRQSNGHCFKFSHNHPNIFALDNPDKEKDYNKQVLEKVGNCRKAVDFQKLIYFTNSQTRIKRYKKDKYNGKRYGWINFHSLFYRGTLEIRNHSGTINYEKINNWLLIHLTVLDFIKKLSFETICNLPNTDEFFLSLFDSRIRKYIKKRWRKFQTPKNEDKEMKGGIILERVACESA